MKITEEQSIEIEDIENYINGEDVSEDFYEGIREICGESFSSWGTSWFLHDIMTLMIDTRMIFTSEEVTKVFSEIENALIED